MEPCRLTAAEAARQIAEGQLTSEALVRSCLERIALRDPEVRAWTHVLDPGQAIAAARERDKEPPRGPLHGLPVGVKDVIDTADLPTSHNSPIYAGHQPARDAGCVSLLRSAGAIILGKTDTVEFAAGGRHPLTRNPLALDRTPGGSSSGSGAAVADFMVPLALGTQTGGSTIRPAAYCGIYAMKPTHDVVSAEGIKVYARTLDTVGWYGRSAADLALVADAYDLLDGQPLSLRPAEELCVVVCRPPHSERARPGTLAALDRAAEQLAGAGVRIERRDTPPEFDRLNDAKETIMRGEARATFLPEYRAHYPLLHEGLRGHVENLTGITRLRLKEALDFAAVCRVSFEAAFADCDAVLTISARGEADEGHADLGDPIFISLWTTLHLPAINLPGMVGPSHLPVGLQLVGRRYMDADLLAVAAAIAPHIDPQVAAREGID